MKIRTLIVDDEMLARERIRTLLREDPEVEVAGECCNGADAIKAIRELAPDLLFLDVQMPQGDGFEVLQALDSGQLPTVVFVTAYDQYALKAFDFFALDYLLKPFHRDRFWVALRRAKASIRKNRQGTHGDRVLELIRSLKSEYLQRLVIKQAGRIFFIKTSEIEWIEAAGNYVQIHTASNSHLLRQTMRALEEALDPGAFLRINRSAIVNLESIKELAPLFHGEYRVVLKNGLELRSSRKLRGKLERMARSPFEERSS